MINKHIDNYYENPTAMNKQLAVLSMTRFIYKIINKYSNSNNEEDLLQQGYIGVLKALETWDSNKGAFTTHCHYQVFDYVMRYLKDEDNDKHVFDNIKHIGTYDNKWFDTFLDIDKKISKFKRNDIEQFLMSIQGWTNEEIAPLFGLGKTGVYWNVNKIKECLNYE